MKKGNKNRRFIFLGVTACIIFLGIFCAVYFLQEGFRWNDKNSKKMSVHQISTDSTNISGKYFSNEGGTAEITSDSNQWRVSYQTADGLVSATFKTDWKIENHNKISISKMKKSDGYNNFTITLRIFKEKQNLITITMSDGKVEHDMFFANRKDYFVSNYDAILQGDLSSFAGNYSNDQLEKAIADSKYTLYGYKPEDYYSNKTSVFPSIRKNIKTGNEWIYWSGVSHAYYKLNATKPPKKINNYYEVYFVGANAIAIEGQELILNLVPANVTGPDGITTKEYRLVYGQSNQVVFRPYRDKWWERYQTVSENEKDLNVEAPQH
ncbi:DUF6287 domain-containing protein [Streptococcus anginosus]|uniref:DUF6287 domain-containing protein n=1 Tax=Streptococcus anginosus TaxID=1328 RepID=UPI00404167CB